jgi:hypothetical protein
MSRVVRAFFFSSFLALTLCARPSIGQDAQAITFSPDDYDWPEPITLLVFSEALGEETGGRLITLEEMPTDASQAQEDEMDCSTRPCSTTESYLTSNFRYFIVGKSETEEDVYYFSSNGGIRPRYHTLDGADVPMKEVKSTTAGLESIFTRLAQLFPSEPPALRDVQLRLTATKPDSEEADGQFRLEVKSNAQNDTPGKVRIRVIPKGVSSVDAVNDQDDRDRSSFDPAENIWTPYSGTITDGNRQLTLKATLAQGEEPGEVNFETIEAPQHVTVKLPGSLTWERESMSWWWIGLMIIGVAVAGLVALRLARSGGSSIVDNSSTKSHARPEREPWWERLISTLGLLDSTQRDGSSSTAKKDSSPPKDAVNTDPQSGARDDSVRSVSESSTGSGATESVGSIPDELEDLRASIVEEAASSARAQAQETGEKIREDLNHEFNVLKDRLVVLEEKFKNLAGRGTAATKVAQGNGEGENTPLRESAAGHAETADRPENDPEAVHESEGPKRVVDVVRAYKQWCREAPMVNRFNRFKEHIEEQVGEAKALQVAYDRSRDGLIFVEGAGNGIPFWMVEIPEGKLIFPTPESEARFKSYEVAFEGAATPRRLKKAKPAILRDSGSEWTLQTKGKLWSN